MTVSGRGRFSSLRVTVSQTENLSNQTVSITSPGSEIQNVTIALKR